MTDAAFRCRAAARGSSLALASLVALACRRNLPAPFSNSPPATDAILPATDATTPALPADADDPVDPQPAAHPPPSITIPLHTTRWNDGPESLGYNDLVAALGGGAVLVYNFVGGGSFIGARLLDADGRYVEQPRVLHTLTEPITAIAADLSEGRLWVTWTTTPGNIDDPTPVLGEQRVYALVADADLTRASRAILLARYRAQPSPRPWEYSSLAIRGLPNGGAVATSAGPSQSCGGVRCLGWSVHTLRPDGTHRTRTEGLPDGARLPWALTRTRTGVVGLVASGPNGRTTHLRTLFGPRSEAEGNYPGATAALLAFDGARLLMVASDADDPSLDQLPRVVAWDDTTRGAPLAGRWAQHPRLTAHALRCVGRRAVVRYEWPGDSMDLDPALAGASVNLIEHLPAGARHPSEASDRAPDLPPPPNTGAAAWTGRVVVRVAHNYGHLERWRCERGALTEVR